MFGRDKRCKEWEKVKRLGERKGTIFRRQDAGVRKLAKLEMEEGSKSWKKEIGKSGRRKYGKKRKRNVIHDMDKGGGDSGIFKERMERESI